MLHLHRAHRADALVSALADLLADPLPDPFAEEVVAVPTRGMERWLAQRLSGRLGRSAGRGDGICAGVLFPPPRRLIGDALAAASGADPELDPWRPERATWPLLEAVEDALSEPWLHALARYLGADADAAETDPVRGSRRLAIVRHLAELYDRYAQHRPAMVCAWADGRDEDGEGRPLPRDARWQAELWRSLRAGIGTASPAERLAPACARLHDEPGLVELPARVAMFGLTRLAAGELGILRALAAQREVHLFLLHPSPALWEAIAAGPAITAASVPARSEDPTGELAAHPLLASWGRDTREMQLVLTGAGAHVDHHHGEPVVGPSLLERLQAGVLADTAPPGAPLAGGADARTPLDPGDRSVQVHACHGRARQVEVLRDAVLHLMAEDPTLEPRDVIVMCPDIENFAPLIEATFGAAEPAPGEAEGEGGRRAAELALPDLRVRLADRSRRQTNPVLAVLAELLELAAQRVTASQVLSFADQAPVRRRFRLRDEDLTRLQRWIGEAGIRWGLDGAHREPFGLADLESGTWRAGLDRLLVGAAMSEAGGRLFGGVLPLDDVDAGAIDLAGRATELVERLGTAIRALATPRPVAAWAEVLGEATEALTATPPPEAWQRAEVARLLEELAAEADGDAAQRPLSLAEIRAALADRLAGRPTRANFRTGHMTVCTLYPMRSVPHRVVCLLGLDDGAFPRRSPRDGDDLMLLEPRIGERDPRSEDRQMLLDALMAASEQLLVTYTGHDERTNLERPPAVPVGELLDAIDAVVRPPSASGRARDQVLVHHPLQPFDQRNFAADALVPERRWSFDRAALGGALALAAPRRPRPPFLERPLPEALEPVIALEDLVAFVGHPVRAFLRRRLRVSLFEDADEVADALPVELDALERYGVGQRLLDSVLAGVEGNAAIRAEIARGTLPPGVLGWPVVRSLWQEVEAIAARARELAPLTAEPPDPIDVRLELPDGRLLSGTVPVAHGDLLLEAAFSRLAPRHRLAAWVRLLAATSAEPDRPLRAATVGRAASSRDEAVGTLALIAPLGADAAERAAVAGVALAAVVDLHDRGMREPLPLPCATAAAYAAAARRDANRVTAARPKWESDWKYPHEDADADHVLAFGGVQPFEWLLETAPAADERGDSWAEEEPSRFGRLARRLWDELLAHEELSSW